MPNPEYALDSIDKVLSFIVEIEKLKGVHRKTRPVGLDRYENSAEHSWHVCLSALMLKDYANEDIDIYRVIKMLLIHDLGEIDTGDTIIYDSETQQLKEDEAAGLERLLNILPEDKSKEYMALWYEFEAGETPDSKYAKAIDRVPPLPHNLHGSGHSWKENKVSKEKVFSLNSRIAKGSEKLWTSLQQKLEKAVEKGVLK
jgi:putative hydrolase of HD superfamily